MCVAAVFGAIPRTYATCFVDRAGRDQHEDLHLPRRQSGGSLLPAGLVAHRAEHELHCGGVEPAGARLGAELLRRPCPRAARPRLGGSSHGLVRLSGGDELTVGRREVDDLARLVTDDPCVMAGRDDGRVAGVHLELVAVLHDEAEAPGHDEQLMRGSAQIRADDRLHVIRPSPSRLHHLAGDGRVAH